MPNREAAELVAKLNKEWSQNEEYNLTALKRFASAQTILRSEPHLQVAVARRMLELISAFATRARAKRKRDWFDERNFPWGGSYLLSSLLKKRLPFKEADLLDMLELVAETRCISASQFPFVGSLVSALERYGAAEGLSKHLRKAAEAVRVTLVGTGNRRRLWDPDAADRKAAARIERLLSGPLDLN